MSVVDMAKMDYCDLDRPEILRVLFHPRPEAAKDSSSAVFEEILIPVEAGVKLGARLYLAGKSAPSILFFHGNGEIVADYDELGPVYTRMGINFLPVDYQGYGRSDGTPTVSAMMRDCHLIFEFMTRHLKTNGHDGALIVMGRSLGSASALELAANYGNAIDGLIIESGFAYLHPLLRLLGVDSQGLQITEDKLSNLDKIESFDKPTLIIHAEKDHIIPFSDGQDLYDRAGARAKSLLKIAGANHNDLFFRGMQAYLQAVKELVSAAAGFQGR